MPAHHIELSQSAPDLLIVQALALEPRQISSGVLRIQQGSLHPALHRPERRGWIKTRWGASENNRRELAKTGRRQLEFEKDAWGKPAAAVAQVVGAA